MTDAQIEAIRRRKFVVKASMPEKGLQPRRIHTAAFDTDLAAVSFMERAVRRGATIIECAAPHA